MSQPLVTHLPFKAGLPPMGRYLRSLIKRRAFISEFARSELRGQNYGSVFGQLWLVINPLLLSGVYFLLIYVIGGSSDATRFAHLTASLFLFYLVANSLTGGVKAITSGQRLILNTSFPRIMLPCIGDSKHSKSAVPVHPTSPKAARSFGRSLRHISSVIAKSTPS